MDLDPGEANPMWARRSALAASSYASHRGGVPRDDAPACRDIVDDINRKP